MLDEYRIEPMSVGQYLSEVKKENIKIDQAVQREFCWSPEMMNALLYSAISRKIYIPNFILAEEKKKNGTKQTYVVDAGQRTETLYQFKYEGYRITKNLRSYLIPYNKKKVDENGEFIRDEYGDIECEIEMFDIRNKTYEELPDELKSKFNGCPLTMAIYQDCTTEETAELVLLYNNHMGMNVSQKSLTYVGKFAEEIKRIKNTSRFLKDATALTENDKKKGLWERVISECVMSVKHFENWKKTPKDMCNYLNNNSSIEEYKHIEKYFNRIAPYADKLENSEVSKLFTTKNMFIWMMLFDRFDKLNISDDRFGEFLKEFVSNLYKKEVNGESWESIDSDKHTKDKSVINKKVDFLENLMNEFLHINKEDLEEVNVLEFVRENVKEDVDLEDIRFYEEMLSDYTVEVDNNSKLLEKRNNPSLIAIVGYAVENEIDLDEWIVNWFEGNKMYLLSQKKNFLHMKKSVDMLKEEGDVA